MPSLPSIFASALRRAGVGKLLRVGVYTPTAVALRTWREGGPWQQRRTRLGRQAMEAAARTLAPLPAPPTDAATVHVLTGRALWYQTAFLFESLWPYLQVRPVIHTDGTLHGESLAALRRMLPFADFVDDETTTARLDQLLPASRYPALRRRREELVLFRKILDVHVGASGWNLFLDSDMLFFRDPEFIRNWLRSPSMACHMIDVVESYGYPVQLLNAMAGSPVPTPVNTGILGLRSDEIDWDQLEEWCAVLNRSPRPSYFQEQALVALHLAGRPRVAAPRGEYLVLPGRRDAESCAAVLHHYVAHSKRWYFQQTWRTICDHPPQTVATAANAGA